MAVDVKTEIVIARPRPLVAAYASDPDNATSWYRNIEHVEWKTPKPIEVGSRIAFVARFLGRRLAYTYVVCEIVSGERFVMATSEGPFAMETTYEWSDEPGGSTTMAIRNRGEPTGFARVGARVMGAAMRRANQNDLKLLKRILESETGSSQSEGQREGFQECV